VLEAEPVANAQQTSRPLMPAGGVTSSADTRAVHRPLELPADVDRGIAPAYAAGVEELALPDGIPDAVRTVSADLSVPAPVLVLTAWCCVLDRHTARRDVVIEVCEPGSADRTRPQQLAVTVDPDDSFARIAVQVRDALGALGALSRGVSGGESARTAPVRAVLASPADPQAAVIPEPRTVAPEVEFVVTDPDARSTLRVIYDSGLFEQATAAAWLRDCSTLLTEAMRAPSAPVHTLRMRAAPEPSGQAPVWELPPPAGFVAPAPPGQAECLADRFVAVAARHGSHTAVTGPSGTYSYAELDAATTTLARRLRTLVRPGARVALLAEHDTGVALGVWAVLKAGCAYVALDPRHPDARLARMAAGSGAGAILCDSSLAGRAARLAKGRPVVPLTADGTETPSGTPLPEGDPDSPAYLLYTSGTTGRPKAVVQTQRNVLAHATTYATRIGLGPGENVSLLPRISSDAAVMDIFGAHLTGASLHVIDPQAPARQLRAELGRAPVSVLHCTPTLLRHLLGPTTKGQEGQEAMQGPEGSERPEGPLAELSGIRVVVLGGEEVTRGDLELFSRGFPATCHLVNGLGPTECTVAFQHLARPEDRRRPTLPVGLPVDGVSVRLLDERLRPTDVFGEIEIVSDRVAVGYWNDEAATSTVFRRSGDGPAAYRTGDLARRLPDGRLVFCGRTDRQIKIRGHRVEPDEVQAVLRAHPTVGQAVVEVDRSSPNGPRLVGYVTPATAMPVDTGELLGYLERTVPDPAVPWQIVPLSAMPVGPTGKVDRARLPEPAPQALNGVDDEPRTALERAIAALWCEVLGLTSVGTRMEWMRCGGDSLQLMTLLGRVDETWAVDVPLLDFLRKPTVAALAEFVERHEADAPGG
jgi:amino acid adenylation domain-containing protein